MDEDTGYFLNYCGARCASELQMHHLVGQGKCSLPGCAGPNMVHPEKREEMGYCCEDHHLRATQLSLVTMWTEGSGGTCVFSTMWYLVVITEVLMTYRRVFRNGV